MHSRVDSVTGRLLVIDDQPQNLRVIADSLADSGVELMLSRSGAHGLEIAEHEKPDLVLLDVLMPEIDGFEVCRRLKADPGTRDIPVVFMTSLDETHHKIQGLKLGAVDYVTKPIEREELLVRIQTHLKLRRLQRELIEQNRLLQEKNTDLESYAHTIAHSLKTPLAATGRFLEILDKYRSSSLTDEQRQLVQRASTTLALSAEVVDALLLMSTVSHESVQLEPLDMAQLVHQVLQQLDELRERTGAKICFPSVWPRALGHTPWVGEVWLNYISNSCKYAGNSPRVELGADPPSDGTIRFWVRDSGRELSEEQCGRLFVPFARLHEEQAIGHGLGLTIVKRIIEKLGGEVGVVPLPGVGNEFFFSLPAASRLPPK